MPDQLTYATAVRKMMNAQAEFFKLSKIANSRQQPGDWSARQKALKDAKALEAIVLRMTDEILGPNEEGGSNA